MGFWEILHPGRRTQYQPVAARVVVLQEGARDSGVGLRDLQSLAPNPESRAPRMEARGIEPRSENDSDTATTCVDEACGLTTAAPRRPRQRQALRTSYMTRSGPRSRQPDFAIRERRLRRAATHAGA